MLKKKHSLIAISLVMLMSLTAACGSTAATKTQSQSKKDIVVADSAEPTTLDPHDTNDTLAYSIQKTMLEGLFGFDKNMKVVSVLAESYTSNTSATEFTIKLRKGVKFQDGTEFNAAAAKANLDRLSDQTQKLKRNSLFSMVSKTDVVDDNTIKIALKYPFGAMINTLAHPAGMMISPKALQQYGKEVSKHPVGTGPYSFKEWIPGTKLTVVKNDKYWGTQAQYNSITFKAVKEDGSRVAMIQTGEADFIYPVPTMQIDKLKADKNISIQQGPSMVVRYVSMNVNKKPFDNIKVRQALNYAIDKKAFAQVVFNGFSAPMKSIIAPNVQFYSEQKQYDYDIEKAKQLLKEAGYADGFKTTLWSGNTSTALKVDEFLQQQLAKVGVTVTVVPQESAALNDKVFNVSKGSKGDVEMYYGGWSPSTGDADWGIRPLLAEESIPPTSYNTAYYSNPESDKLIKAALSTSDSSTRGDAYAKAQKILWDECPWIFLVDDINISASRSNITGLSILPDGSLLVTPAK